MFAHLIIDVATDPSISLPEVKVALIQPMKAKKRKKLPLPEGAERIIIATCETGETEDFDAMKDIKSDVDVVKKANPNYSEYASNKVFRSPKANLVADPLPKRVFTAKGKRRRERMQKRSSIRIGIPRVLNMYSLNPLFAGYFEALGIKPRNLIYSDFTNEELYKSGTKRGSIDPCFPSKVGIPHVHNLLFVKHKKWPLDYIFFPMVDALPSIIDTGGTSRACPTVQMTPDVVKAAFTQEDHVFNDLGITYLSTFTDPGEPELFTTQMYDEFKDILGVSKAENARAVNEGFRCLQAFYDTMRSKAIHTLEELEANNGIGVVVLGRPYHNDPGITHDIFEEFQIRGYPVFTIDSLPINHPLTDQLFADDVANGVIKTPMDIDDVWKNSYSENTNRKIWAAKFTARHPNLVALEMSSFKCGHDAPIYATVEEIIEKSGTPYFCFKDLDENKPAGSIKIRIETIEYFLKRYQDTLAKRKKKEQYVSDELSKYKAKLYRDLAGSMGDNSQTISPRVALDGAQEPSLERPPTQKPVAEQRVPETMDS